MIGKNQIYYIQNQAQEIIKTIDSKEIFDKHLAQLNSDCVICYNILEKISKESLESSKRLENGKLNNINKDLSTQNQAIIQEIRKVRKDVYITSERFGNGVILIIILKGIFTIALVPILLLPGVFRDPYKYQYCDNHFHVRPIKKERIFRFAVYMVVLGLGLGFILFLRFI